jgi:hypothetical protein
LIGVLFVAIAAAPAEICGHWINIDREGQPLRASDRDDRTFRSRKRGTATSYLFADHRLAGSCTERPHPIVHPLGTALALSPSTRLARALRLRLRFRPPPPRDSATPLCANMFETSRPQKFTVGGDLRARDVDTHEPSWICGSRRSRLP